MIHKSLTYSMCTPYITFIMLVKGKGNVVSSFILSSYIFHFITNYAYFHIFPIQRITAILIYFSVY
jgi:hypothetical protein